MTDPISDMLARIRNTMSVGKRVTRMPHSNAKVRTLEVLKSSGYIHDFEVIDQVPQKAIKVIIAEDEKPFTITKMQRESRPGRRVYVKADNVPKVMNGRGIAVISTPMGVMTGDEAKAKGVGGEVICSIY